MGILYFCADTASRMSGTEHRATCLFSFSFKIPDDLSHVISHAIPNHRQPVLFCIDETAFSGCILCHMPPVGLQIWSYISAPHSDTYPVKYQSGLRADSKTLHSSFPSVAKACSHRTSGFTMADRHCVPAAPLNSRQSLPLPRCRSAAAI